jgi:hypothetical protein
MSLVKVVLKEFKVSMEETMNEKVHLNSQQLGILQEKAGIHFLPDPLAPTSARLLAAGTLKQKSLKMYDSGRDGYAKVTCFSSTSPFTSLTSEAFSLSGSISVFRSIMLKIDFNA